MDAESSVFDTRHGPIEYIEWGNGPPVLAVRARGDRINPFAIGETVAKRILDSKFIDLDTGGHLLLGHHSGLRERIEVFLAEQLGQ